MGQLIHGGGVISKPNLLDNWDFTNPVNQRNITSTTDYGYIIDRWTKVGGLFKTLNTGINMSGSSSSKEYVTDIRQWLDSDTIKSIIGKTVTISVDMQLDTIQGGHFYISLCNETKQEFPSNDFYSTFGRKTISIIQEIPSTWESTDQIRFTFGSLSTSANFTIYACKLELGVISTLKNDSYGNNYLNEWNKCRRYFQRHIGIYVSGIWYVNGDVRVNSIDISNMRKLPTITIDSAGIRDRYGFMILGFGMLGNSYVNFMFKEYNFVSEYYENIHKHGTHISLRQMFKPYNFEGKSFTESELDPLIAFGSEAFNMDLSADL